MKPYNWNIEKNIWLKANKNISFEEVVLAIALHQIKDVYEHPNQSKYPNQKFYKIELNDYIYLVPLIESANELFLKTIIPGRKATKKYK